MPNDEVEMKKPSGAVQHGQMAVSRQEKNNKVIANSRLPSWLTRDGEQIVPISERVAIIERDV